jgi:hypothetical protein
MSTSSDLVMWGGVAPLVLLNPVIVFLLAIASEALICARDGGTSVSRC